jgi:hypothetical protein
MRFLRFVMFVALIGFGVWWIYQRRDKVKEYWGAAGGVDGLKQSASKMMETGSALTSAVSQGSFKDVIAHAGSLKDLVSQAAPIKEFVTQFSGLK